MLYEPTYDELFQDKLVFDSLGAGEYYEDTYPSLIKKRNLKPSRFIKYILNYAQRARLRPKKKGNLLFLEHKFEHIARNLSGEYNIYMLHDSIRIYKSVHKYRYFQYFYRTWLKEVDKSYLTHNMHYAIAAMRSVQKFLVKNDIDIVFIGNDKMFIEKLLLFSSRNVNIPVVVIQHGIYTDEISFKKLRTADTADIFWTWSQYVKDAYLERFGKDECKVKVVGYPFELLEKKNIECKAVLFLGNNYRKTNPKEETEFIRMIKTVLDICKELGIPFFFRPHPGEIIDDEYKDISGYIMPNNTLLEDLQMVSIVIGDISSAMVEAALCGRNVIQIIWNELSTNASEDPMYSFTIKVTDKKEDIRRAIIQCLVPSAENTIDPYYMYKNPMFFDDIHSYVEELISNKLR